MRIKTVGLLAIGAAAGGLLTYYLDTERGHRRRVVLRDKMRSTANRSRHNAQRRLRYMGRQTWGRLIELSARLRGEHVDDEILVQRVRARIGKAVRHAHPICVTANHGAITLSGPISSREINGLLSDVLHTRGVHQVIDDLDVRVEHSS